MYIKLIKDNKLVDFLEEPNYVGLQDNGIFVITTENPDGVLNYNSTIIYQLDKKLGSSRFTGPVVTPKEISKKEYDRLVAQYGDGRVYLGLTEGEILQVQNDLVLQLVKDGDL